MTIRGIGGLALIAASIAAVGVPPQRGEIDSLKRQFLHPPDDARMMVRWWWFGPAIAKPELEREMRSMKDARHRRLRGPTGLTLEAADAGVLQSSASRARARLGDGRPNHHQRTIIRASSGGCRNCRLRESISPRCGGTPNCRDGSSDQSQPADSTDGHANPPPSRRCRSAKDAGETPAHAGQS